MACAGKNRANMRQSDADLFLDGQKMEFCVSLLEGLTLLLQPVVKAGSASAHHYSADEGFVRRAFQLFIEGGGSLFTQDFNQTMCTICDYRVIGCFNWIVRIIHFRLLTFRFQICPQEPPYRHIPGRWLAGGLLTCLRDGGLQTPLFRECET